MFRNIGQGAEIILQKSGVQFETFRKNLEMDEKLSFMEISHKLEISGTFCRKFVENFREYLELFY